MDPGRRKPLNAVNNTQYGVSAAEMPTAPYRSRMSVAKFSRTMPGRSRTPPKDAAAMTARSDIMMTVEDTVAHET
jgi:hypothetical protein